MLEVVFLVMALLASFWHLLDGLEVDLSSLLYLVCLGVPSPVHLDQREHLIFSAILFSQLHQKGLLWVLMKLSGHLVAVALVEWVNFS